MTTKRVAAFAAAIAVFLLAAVPVAHAGPTSTTTAIVAMGDSFISGEAGRWQGNSLNFTGTRDGTDRAARCTLGIFCSYDAHRVYGSSYDNGCHRSDVAEIKSAPISVSEKINIACSGAKTNNMWRASQGGQVFKGEAPQGDQLATIAQQKNVKLIVLTISANDLGFTDHVINCTVAWTLGYTCHAAEQASIEAGLPAARDGLRKSVNEIRGVMSAAGYSSSQYRLVMQGYSSPIPRGADNRYPETGWSRLTTGGCPFWNVDSDWAKDQATPTIVDNMRTVASEKGVQFLDVRNALNGHEVCNKASTLVDGSHPVSSVTNEWVRWLNSGCCQGDAQESLHPNAWGQRAIGRCVSLVYAQPTGNWSCRNTAGQAYTAMTLASIP
jgi:GDSL-like Lipase/Acylhydrolase family